MRRIEQLIDIVRKLSQNTRYDATSGVPQDVFVQFLNNAQDALTMEVQNLKTKYFLKQEIVQIVPNQEKYDYPSDCYMHHIDTIQWTDSAAGTYWTTLYKTTTKEKITIQPGYPFAYVPREDGIYLNPPIGRGKLYITFVRTPRKLAKRSGKISSATIVGSSLTALTLDITDSSFDSTELSTDYYFCVVDKFGIVKANNILYDSVNPTNGVVTLSAFDLGAETLAAGDYVCVGKNVVNVPQYLDIAESYLIKHAVYEAKMGDSSAWTAQAIADMNNHFSKLSGSFATLSDDVTQIVVNNLDYIGW